MLHPHVVGNFTQRLWAYLTIKELLNKRLISDDAEEKEEFEERALNLSLKYHFVTPLTSLVVVKPDGSNDTTSEKTEENLPKEPRGPMGPVGRPRGLPGPPSSSMYGIPRYGGK